MKEELKESIRAFLLTLRNDPKPTDAECEALHAIVTEIAKPTKAKK